MPTNHMPAHMTDVEALRTTHQLLRERAGTSALDRANTRTVLEMIEAKLQEMGEPLYPVQKAPPILSWPHEAE